MRKQKALLLLIATLILAAFVVWLALKERDDSRSRYRDQITGDNAPSSSQAIQNQSADRNEVQPPVSENSGQNQKPVEPSEYFYDADGTPHTLEEFADRPVVLSLWSVNKGKSTQNLELLEEAYQEYGDKVYFIVIHVSNENATKERSIERAAEEGCTFPVYHDPDGAFLNQYEKNKVPLTLYFQKNLDPIAYTDDTLTEKALQSGIKAILPQ